MEALVAEELRTGADPQQACDLLVRIIHKTMLQPEQEVCYALWGVQSIDKSSCTEDEMLTS